MGALLDTYIKLDVLEELVKILKKKGEKGIAITTSVNDETNQYGQNTVSFVSQSKEQRDEKKPKYYIGNGKVFWTNGKIDIAEKKEQSGSNQSTPIANTSDEIDDLPF